MRGRPGRWRRRGRREGRPRRRPQPVARRAAGAGAPHPGLQRPPVRHGAGLDASFDAALFVGYHSRAGSGGHPLAHTLSRTKLFAVRLDGAPASEYRLHRLAAATTGVPVVLVTGDRTRCDEAAADGVRTVAVSEGIGSSTTSLHPRTAVERIRPVRTMVEVAALPAAATAEVEATCELRAR